MATGMELAEGLLRGVGSEGMRAATRLLGAHRDGYWLREGRLPVESGEGGTVDWDQVGRMLDAGQFKGSSTEMAVLGVAASLVDQRAVQLGRVVRTVGEADLAAIIRALTEAAYGTDG